jgi:hypothetical protein
VSPRTREPKQALSILLLLLLGAGGLTVVGHAVARRTIDDGIEQFGADPVAYAVAKQAHAMAWLAYVDHPDRLLVAAVRVVEVAHRPGHCQDRSGDPTRDYVARVRFHTFFGLPFGDIHLTCGGWGMRHPLTPVD